MYIPDKIRIGTRGSLLALAQTDLFIRRIKSIYPQIECEKVILKTTGDRILDRPLLSFGGKGVFVNEFEEAIKRGEIDYAVHSAKDMPMELLPGLEIVCVLKREDARDVLVTRKDHPVPEQKFAQASDSSSAPSGAAVIGTGSLRRQVQLENIYPNVCCKNLRGNVPTRLEKLKNGEYDGVILAAAGLKRLGLDAEDALEYRYFDLQEMVPAGGQAVIAIEGRSGKEQEFLQCLTDEKTRMELEMERRILKRLDAGCHEAVGVYAEIRETQETAGEVISVRLMKEISGRIVEREGCAALTEREALADQLVLSLEKSLQE